MARTLTNEIITAAIDGYESQKARIDAKIAELQAMLPGSSVTSDGAGAPARSRRRRMSAAGRARIAAAQKKRWAARRGAEAVTPEPSKPKRRLSRAGKAAIVAALKKRWAATRAEAAKAQSGTKKAVSARKKKTVKKAARKAPPAKAATAPANAQAGA